MMFVYRAVYLSLFSVCLSLSVVSLFSLSLHSRLCAACRQSGVRGVASLHRLASRPVRVSQRLVGRGGDGLEGRVLVRDLVHGGEEGELVLEALHLEHMVDLLGCESPLQLLPAQQLRLDLVERLALAVLGKGLGALAVPPAEARGDEVRHAAALEEGVVV